MAVGERFLKFRCTGCGNCCKEPLLPLNDVDLSRLVDHTGESPLRIVKWVTRHEIAMEDEPEAFIRLRQGKRVMVLGHRRGRCRFLGADDRCTVYTERPTGCRVFPFDPEFKRDGSLKRLKLIQATDCLYALDGHNDVDAIRTLRQRHNADQDAYYERIAVWNREQQRRQRKGLGVGTPRAFLNFLGVRFPAA
ncbi:MAG: YkgJ family cysteine cluster protein [Polyangiaceae bacterium]